MKKIKNILQNIFIGTLFVSMLASCEDQGYDDYGEETVATVAMNGEWMIEISDEAGNVYGSHLVHKTYELNGQLWISDRVGSSNTFTGWWLEAPLDANLGNLTFSATEELNTADESVVTITEGKILKNAAVSPSGAIVDSIYFKAVFDYDPGTTLVFAGQRRTGFQEDE
jgi:hypothetical protein